MSATTSDTVQADTLDAVLEQLSREFFTSENHLRLDHDRRRVAVSAILDFYTKDFASSGQAKDLISYINRYRDEAIPAEYHVGFSRLRLADQPTTLNGVHIRGRP